MTNKRNILLAVLFAAHVSVEATSSVQFNVFNKNAASLPSSPVDTSDASQSKADAAPQTLPQVLQQENPVVPNVATKADEPVVNAQGASDATSSEAVKNPVKPNAAQKTDELVVKTPESTPSASSVVLEIKKLGEDKADANSKSKSASIDSQDANKGMFASVGAYCSGAVGGASAAVTAHPALAVAGGAAIVAAVIWTVYAHKITQRAKTLEQELDELESAV